MAVKTKPRQGRKVLNWATVNTQDPKEMAELHRQEEVRAGQLARRAVAELQALGIIDKQGRRIKKELPPDMGEDSACDL